MRWVNYIFQSTLNFYRYIYWDSIVTTQKFSKSDCVIYDIFAVLFSCISLFRCQSMIKYSNRNALIHQCHVLYVVLSFTLVLIQTDESVLHIYKGNLLYLHYKCVFVFFFFSNLLENLGPVVSQTSWLHIQEIIMTLIQLRKLQNFYLKNIPNPFFIIKMLFLLIGNSNNFY